MPEISVIMAVYNAGDGKALKGAVKSILHQTCEDFEYIICDDGSSDQTWEILKEIAKRDRRIRLIRNKRNRKAGYARNRCIRAAAGKYIAVMDADDLSAADRLKKQKDFLDANPGCAFVGSRGEFFKQKIGDDGEMYWFCEAPEGKDFLFSNPFVHASCMFRREVLEETGGYAVDKGSYRVEDYDLLLRIYGKGYVGKNLPEVLYYIRRDDAQYKRRKYRYRLNEARMKYRGFRQLGLLPGGMIYVVKPLIAGLIPWRVSALLQKRYYKSSRLPR